MQPNSKTLRYLSGIQPSGALHLGNYFGAIEGHIASQAQPNTECFYFIANYHSMTSLQNREALLENTRDVAVAYLALGLDPQRSVFYRQSDVPEVTELTWILSTCVGMGLLERAHSYKDKVARGLNASVGLFTYPVLMAADILGPQSDIVPVGQDQTQHVEMTRNMAAAFNSTYCKEDEPVFKLPEVRFTEIPKVPGTTFDKGDYVEVQVLATTKDVINSFGQVAFREQMFDAIRGFMQGNFVTNARLQTTGDIENELQHVSSVLAPGTVDVFVRHGDSCPEPKPIGEDRIPGTNIEIEGSETNYRSVRFTLPLCRTVTQTDKEGKRVAAKMSKSYHNTIEIFAEGKALKKAVMGIETDKKALEDPLDPDDDLVFALYRLFASEDEQGEMRENYRRGGFGYGNAKKALLAKIDEHFAEARERRKELLQRPDEIEEILQEGAKKARRVIGATTAAARDACGIPPLAP